MIPRKTTLAFAILVIFSIGIYLMVSWWIFDLGFPVDDAWIHQTYARNFARTGRWEFQRGQVSGGSTGPLWGFLLAGVHFLSPDAFWGAYLLGGVLLWGTALMSGYAYRELVTEKKKLALIAGLLVIFEWHLVWAAASGMETLAFTLVALVIVGNLLSPNPAWFSLGIAVGISVWLRPGGITLLGPILFTLVAHHSPVRRSHRVWKMFVGLGLVVLPYLIFNRLVAGDFLPNTFYAKQAEYAAMKEIPLLTRAGQLTIQPLIGAGIVLLPGFLFMLADLLRRREWKALTGPLWAGGYIGIYAWRLPVTYQHGRYLIPVIPVFLVWGVAGFMRWIDLSSPQTLKRVLSKAWVGVLIVTTVIFWGLGARAYGRDVAVIETEMVRVARWVERNTEERAVLAAHDIGALGYFSERKIVDMAGLVSPDVIPFIRNETKLRQYLNNKEVDYLITFPGWYDNLENGLELAFQTQGTYANQFDQENMAVYHWKLTTVMGVLGDHDPVCPACIPVLYSQRANNHFGR